MEYKVTYKCSSRYASDYEVDYVEAKSPEDAIAKAMKVQAKGTTQVLRNGETQIAFERGRIYEAKKGENFGYNGLYIVTNELGENNLYCDEAFNKSFKIVGR